MACNSLTLLLCVECLLIAVLATALDCIVLKQVFPHATPAPHL